MTIYATSNGAGLRIAVVGVSSLIGEAVIDELRVRKIGFTELHALEDERNLGRPVTDDEGSESAKTLVVSDVAAFGGGLKGRVSVCASVSAIAETLLDDIASFMREPEYQNIRVDIEERLSFDLVRQLREGAASIGVCWDNVDLRGLQHRPYRRDLLALAVHPDHPLASETSLRFVQTLEHEHVGLRPSTAVHAMLQRAAATAGKTVSYRVIVSSFDAAFRVVAAGLGISVVPVEVAEAYLPVLGIKIIPLTDAWAQRRFVVCFKSFDALQPAAQRMVEYLVNRVDGQLSSDPDSKIML